MYSYNSSLNISANIIKKAAPYHPNKHTIKNPNIVLVSLDIYFICKINGIMNGVIYNTIHNSTNKIRILVVVIINYVFRYFSLPASLSSLSKTS